MPMNEETKKNINQFFIKVALTVPAIFIGLLAAVLFIFEPLLKLWFPTKFQDKTFHPGSTPTN